MYATMMKKPPVNPDTSCYDVFTFRWSDTEYTPRELERLLGRRMPFLVMTTQGYMGRDEHMNAMTSDEMYWLREVAKQPRLVVRSESDGYFSIPLNYPQRVFPTTGQNVYTNEDPITIKELMAAGHNSFMFARENKRSTKQSVYNGPNECNRVNFGQVEIIDQYEEKYLVGHTLPGGMLYHEPCVIPLYMPITMVIAAGMAHGDHAHFYRSMLSMKAYVESVPPEMRYPRQLRETSDILMYEGKPEEGEYDCLEPLKYLSLTRGKADNSDAYASLGAEENPYVLENAYATASELSDSLSPDLTPEKEKKHKKITIKKLKIGRGKSKDKPESTGNSIGSNPSAEEVSEVEAIIDSRGGARGPDTNIAARAGRRYHISDLHPEDILAELRQVLESGVIPEESRVFLDDHSEAPNHIPVQLKMNDNARQSPLRPAPDIPERDDNSTSNNSPEELQAPYPPWNVRLTPPKLPPNPMANQQTNPQPHPKKPPPPVLPKTPQSRGSDVRASLAEELASVKFHQLRPVHRKDMEPTAEPSVVAEVVENPPPRPQRQGSTQTKPSHRASHIGVPPDQRPAGGTDAGGRESKDEVEQSRPLSTAVGGKAIPNQPAQSSNHVTIGSNPRPTEQGFNPLNSAESVATPSRYTAELGDESLDISKLSQSQLGEWLCILNLGMYKEKFENEQVDGSLLLEMDAEILTNDFGFRKFDAMKLMKFAKEGWTPR